MADVQDHPSDSDGPSNTDEPLPSVPPLAASGANTSITVSDTDGAAIAYVDVVGEIAIHKLNQWQIKDDGRKCAELFVRALQELVKPRDALEKMLLLQMAFTHARITRLSVVAMDQDRTKNVQVVNAACDRAADLFRRQMLALAEPATADPRLNRPKVAVELAQKAVTALPDAGHIWNTLGVALYRDGRSNDAIAALERSRGRGPALSRQRHRPEQPRGRRRRQGSPDVRHCPRRFGRRRVSRVYFTPGCTFRNNLAQGGRGLDGTSGSAGRGADG